MGPYFFIFVLVWIYLRHYINIKILISEFTEFKTVGPYGVVWETECYKGAEAHIISTALLSALQALNIFWTFFVLRIGYRYVFHNVHEDDRSEAEDEEEEEIQDAAAPALQLNGRPVAKTTGVDIKTDSVTNRKTTA